MSKSTKRKDKVVDELCATVAKSLISVEQKKGAGFSVWPMPIFHPAEGELYTAPYFIPKLYSTIKSLREKGQSDKQIAKLLVGPSRIAQIIWLFSSFSIVPMTKKEKVSLVLDIVKFISLHRKDIYCCQKANRILSQKSIKKNLKRVCANGYTREYKSLLGRINGITWLMCELLYFDFHGVGHEIHGPYYVRDKTLLVREYNDLKPTHWRFTRTLPFNSLKVYEVYNGKMELEFDLFNRTRWLKPISSKLDTFSVMTDGRIITTPPKLRLAVNQLEKTVVKGQKAVLGMKKPELLKKFAESYFYILKPLQAALEKGWKPPRQLYQDIDNGKQKKIVKLVLAGLQKTGQVSPQKAIRMLTAVFDPRVDPA